MKISLIAIGKIKKGAERQLIDDYLDRANKIGRQIGIHPITETSIDEPANSSAHAVHQTGATMLKHLNDGVTWRFDETGEALTSLDWAREIEKLRDKAVPRLNMLIGGADGFDEGVIKASHRTISMGRMTWPHKLARIMASEQIYRAMAILNHMPYHREG